MLAQANKASRWMLACLLTVACMPTHASDGAVSYRYANVRMGGGGFVSGLLYHPAANGLLYARTDVGGAYRWDQARAQWTPLQDWLPAGDNNLYGVDSLAVDPRDAKRLYLLTGTYTFPAAGNGAVLISTDRGSHFTRSDLPFPMGGNEQGRNNGERLAVDPNDGRILFLGSRTAGLWRSADHGAHWAKVDGFPAIATSAGTHATHATRAQPVGIVFVVFDPTSGRPGHPSRSLYAGVSTQDTSLYHSTDGGQSWSAVAGQPDGLRPHHMLRAGDGAYYLTFGDEPGPDSVHDGAVWKYTPADGQWTDITPLPRAAGHPSGYGWDGVAVDAKNPQVVMTATFGHYTPKDLLFRSTDGGQHWQEVFAHSQFDTEHPVWLKEHTPHWIASIAIDPHDADRAWFVTGYGVWAANDLGQLDHGGTVHWQFLDQGLEEIVPKAIISPSAGAHLISAMYDLDGYRHDELEVAPPQFATPPRYTDADDVDYAGGKPDVIVRSGWLRQPSQPAVRAAYSTDGGNHWQAFANEPANMEGEGGGSIAIAADAGHVLWFPREAKHGYLTADFGQHWQTTDGLEGHLHVVADRLDPQRFYAVDAAQKTLFVSRDGGAHFQPIHGDLGAFAGSASHLRLHASPDVAGQFYLSSHEGLVLGNDTGARLASTRELSSVDAFGFGMPAPGRSQATLYAAGTRNGEAGIFRSIDEGQHWLRIDDDAHRYGEISMITGDPRLFGRVYFGTSGRGIVYGDPAKAERP
ncbi:sialidase family protein [Dyella humicola]|uniref:sialidase family protein n=1 Tax=Dyella humicola TaxID=2992126 RepID=UPI00224F527B|nr:sialidase family protein [Dyella humicola]